jgi:signal peptidase II
MHRDDATAARALPWWRWLGVSAVVVLLDLVTKSWATAALEGTPAIEVTPFFNLVLAHNAGAAFSFLADAGGWQRWFFIAVTFVVSVALVVMLARQASGRVLAWAYALVLGGALGNLWDRLTLGHVVDFVQLHAAGYYFPAFNVADSAISIGVVLIIWDSFWPARRAPAGVETEAKP